MRRLTSSSLIAVIALAGACSGLPSRTALPPVKAGSGWENSVFPVYIDEPGQDDNLVRYRAGTAVCVAPRLMATSSALFYHSAENAVTVDLNGVIVGDFRNPLKVKDVDANGPIALILLISDCRPFVAAVALPKEGERVTAAAVGYDPVEAGKRAAPRWNISEGTVTSASADAGRLSIRTPTAPGQAGAPIINAAGNLAGIVIFRHGPTVSAITAQSLLNALSGLGE